MKYGPVELDPLSKIKLEDIITIGCAKFSVGFFIEQTVIG